MKTLLGGTFALAASALAASPVQAGQTVDYSVEGDTYQGYHAPAQGQSKGSVVIIHDWDGLTDYEVRRADMLAEMGYDAFAADLYGKGNRPTDTQAKKAEVAKLYDDRAAIRDRTLAALEQSRQLGAANTIVMGYCFGGPVITELARSGQADDVKGFAAFHGAFTSPEATGYSEATPPLLIAHGAADSAFSLSELATLTQTLEDAGATYEVQTYSSAPHGFTVFDSDGYQERADQLSWQAFSDFLTRQLSTADD